jgi:hypothetical protein
MMNSSGMHHYREHRAFEVPGPTTSSRRGCYGAARSGSSGQLLDHLGWRASIPLGRAWSDLRGLSNPEVQGVLVRAAQTVAQIKGRTQPAAIPSPAPDTGASSIGSVNR